MKEILKPGLTLFLITFIASALLGAVYYATAPLILENNTREKKAAMSEVLPLVKDNKFGGDRDINPVPATGVLSYSIGYNGSKAVGYAITVREAAYNGAVLLLVGVDLEGTVTGIKLLEHNETPGLGANAKTEKFSSQYIGKKSGITVTKNTNPADNEISAISSATITSEAVTAGVNAALEFSKTITLESEEN